MLSIAPLHIADAECSVPSLEQQAQKKASALTRLKTYIERCGGQLAAGWDCAVRFRVTTRKSGRVGITTDNFYYSPTGETFRNHKQVADFLGLTEHQLSEQPIRNDGVTVLGVCEVTAVNGGQQCSSAQSEQTDSANLGFSCSSLPKRSGTDSSGQQPVAKKQRVVPVRLRARQTNVPTFDLSFAAQAARSASMHSAALAAQAALAGPAVAPPSVRSSAPAASSEGQHEKEQSQQGRQTQLQRVSNTQSAVPVMPRPQLRPITKTKATLAAKYSASCAAVSHASSVHTAAPSGEQNDNTAFSFHSSAISSTSAGVSSTPRHGQQAAAAPSRPVAQQQPCIYLTHEPCVSTCNSITAAAGSSAAAAPCSTDCTASSSQQQPTCLRVCKTKELKPLCMQRHQQQPQVPKVYKPKKQPAWRANLRMLATQIAAGNGLGSSANGSTLSIISAATQQLAESRPAAV